MKQQAQNINLMCEWIHLASRKTNSNTTQITALEIAEKYSIDVERLLPLLKPCIDLENELGKTIDSSTPDFEFFFSALHNEKQTLAQLFIPLFLENRLATNLDSISDDEWLHAFINIIGSLLDEDDPQQFKDQHSITTVSDLTQIIMQSELQESIKYRLLVLVSQPKWCVKRLIEMYQVHESIWSTFEDSINTLAHTTLQRWFDKYESIFELIEEKISIKGIPSFEETEVIPSLFNFNYLMILNKDPFSFDLKQPVLHIGFLIFDLNDLIKNLSFNNERIQIALKTLADKSKFEILKLCLDNTLYGQQVASALKITTATASYHLNALVNLGYLSMNVDANRIYYQTQTEKIIIDLDQIKSMFTK
jgi:DNA-binding HxlR family transcriptional regulator